MHDIERKLLQIASEKNFGHARTLFEAFNEKMWRSLRNAARCVASCKRYAGLFLPKAVKTKGNVNNFRWHVFSYGLHLKS